MLRRARRALFLLLILTVLLLLIVCTRFHGTIKTASVEEQRWRGSWDPLYIFVDDVTSISNASAASSNATLLVHTPEYNKEPVTKKPSLSAVEWENIVSISQNENITARGEWQVQQIETFCRKHNFDTAYILPPEGNRYFRHYLLRHLIFDDQRGLVFCFVPKVGCTNLRRLMFVMQGLIPAETAKENSISESDYLTPAMRKVSFANVTLTDSDRLERLETYYKFMIIRNPLERLLSAYLNKLEPFMQTNYSKTDNLLVNGIRFSEGKENLYFESHKQFILTRFRPLDLLKSGSSGNNLQLSFSDYVEWIIDTRDVSLNEHFASQLTASHPCMVKYHFYANFKNYSRDVRLLIHKLNTNEDYFTDHRSHAAQNHTRLLLDQYYSQLSPELKYRLFQRMFVELDFYYHLYPEEQWSHVQILGITESVLTANAIKVTQNLFS